MAPFKKLYNKLWKSGRELVVWFKTLPSATKTKKGKVTFSMQEKYNKKNQTYSFAFEQGAN